MQIRATHKGNNPAVCFCRGPSFVGIFVFDITQQRHKKEQENDWIDKSAGFYSRYCRYLICTSTS